MPYIKAEDRLPYERFIQNIVADMQTDTEIEIQYVMDLAKLITTAGNANYVISSIIWRLFDAKPSYTFGNHLISVVEDVKSCLAHKNSWTDQMNEPLYNFLKALCYSIRDNYMGIRGMLTCVALEFYRRRMVDYEILKTKENGDIL